MVKNKPTHYDPQADVLYLVSKEGAIERSQEVSPGITIEYDAQGDVVGVEVLRASKILTHKIIALLHAHQAGVL